MRFLLVAILLIGQAYLTVDGSVNVGGGYLSQGRAMGGLVKLPGEIPSLFWGHSREKPQTPNREKASAGIMMDDNRGNMVRTVVQSNNNSERIRINKLTRDWATGPEPEKDASKLTPPLLLGAVAGQSTGKTKELGLVFRSKIRQIQREIGLRHRKAQQVFQEKVKANVEWLHHEWLVMTLDGELSHPKRWAKAIMKIDRNGRTWHKLDWLMGRPRHQLDLDQALALLDHSGYYRLLTQHQGKDKTVLGLTPDSLDLYRVKDCNFLGNQVGSGEWTALMRVHGVEGVWEKIVRPFVEMAERRGDEIFLAEHPEVLAMAHDSRALEVAWLKNRGYEFFYDSHQGDWRAHRFG